MITDHNKANGELKAFPSSKGIKVPKAIGTTNNAELLKLKVLSGDTFDKSHVNLMIDDHKADVAEFERLRKVPKTLS
jgi:putative membrane protein